MSDILIYTEKLTNKLGEYCLMMQHIEMRGTKKLIFEKAIELFANKSYETVTIQELADALGRRKSGIYNHFKSKQDILDTAYDFFCEKFTADRLTLEQFAPIIENGSVIDMIRSVYYSFAGEYQILMLNIHRIIHQRKFNDARAKIIAKELLIDSGIKYVEAVFDKAIEVGRLAPFDTHAMSMFCNNNRIGLYMEWVLEPTAENFQRLAQEEDKLNLYAAACIVDLKPSETACTSSYSK